MLDPAKVFLQLYPLTLKLQRFLFGVLLQSPICRHCLNFFQTINTGLDRGEVRQHTTEPAVIDKVLVGPQ